jgi:hypothetical protein
LLKVTLEELGGPANAVTPNTTTPNSNPPIQSRDIARSSFNDQPAAKGLHAASATQVYWAADS